MKKLIYLFVMVIVVSGCASTRAAGSWVGGKYEDLVYTWGVPAGEKTLADGKKIVEYNHSRFSAANQYFCSVTFFVDCDGTIEKYNIDGNVGGCNYLLWNKQARPNSSSGQ